MGNQFTSDDQLSQSFQQQYTFNEHPYLINKSTGQPFTIHKVTTNSSQQTNKVLQSVERYRTSKCACISKLKQYYHKENKSYCSDRQNIYFLFCDHSKNTIKDQYLLRRFAEHRFSPHEIQIILSAMLCGTRQYNNKFSRIHKPMLLQNLCIQPKTHRMYVKDPWLVSTSITGSFNNVMLTYPSPEKLNTLYQDKETFYDQYYSQFFTIGMLGLQLYQMDFVDEVYNPKRKQIQNQKLNKLIDNLPNDYNLKNGIRILLQQKPARRSDIFNQWKINCQTLKKLDRLQKQIDRQFVNFYNNEDEMKNSFLKSSSNQMTGYFNQKNMLDGSHSSNFNKNMNQTDFHSSNALNNSNYYKRDCSSQKNEYRLMQPINIHTPVPIKQDQFNNTVHRFSNSSVPNDKTVESYHISQYHNDNNNNNLQHRGQLQRRIINLEPHSLSLYHNKSTSSLLHNNKKFIILQQPKIQNQTLYNNNNSSHNNIEYNFSKSKRYQNHSPNITIPFKQQFQIQPTSFNYNNKILQGNDQGTKLLSIKKPGNLLNNSNNNNNNAIVFKKIIAKQKETPSFNQQYNTTAKFNQINQSNINTNTSNINQPMINSFNTNNVNNSIKLSLDKNKNTQLNNSKITQLGIASNNHNANINILNAQSYQIPQHSSSLGKQSKTQLNNNLKSFDVSNGRQRSISNQQIPSFLNTLINKNNNANNVNSSINSKISSQNKTNEIQKEKIFSQNSSLNKSTQKFKLNTNKIAVNNVQIKQKNNFDQCKQETISTKNGILTIKDNSNKQLKQDKPIHFDQQLTQQNPKKLQSFNLNNIIKGITKQQSFISPNQIIVLKEQENTNKNLKKVETKSPINQWKNNQQQNKKLNSPQKVLQSTKIQSNFDSQPSQNTQDISISDKGIFNQIKSYADNLLSFKTNLIGHQEKKAQNTQVQKKQEFINFNPNINTAINNPLSLNGIKDTTPNRPTNKNKYNSTIVQVNEETPEVSQNSNQGQIQYVIQQYQTGSRYQGQKKNGMRNGKGKFYYQDGGHYQGQWKNNKMHGWGKLFYQGGRLAYQGHWSQDQFHGYGKVYNDNPILLDGPFDYTNFDMLDDYWIYYEGTLVSDTKEGRGKIKLTNGEIFEGDFHADRIQGFGKYYTIDDNFIQGIWRQSKLIKVLQTS